MLLHNGLGNSFHLFPGHDFCRNVEAIAVCPFLDHLFDGVTLTRKSLLEYLFNFSILCVHNNGTKRS